MTALRNFTIGMILAIICLILMNSAVSAQGVVTGDDQLLALEATAELCEYRAEQARIHMNETSKKIARTAAERAERAEKIVIARKLYYSAKAQEHRAKGAWCTYYAELVGEAPDNLARSAYLHRRRAQEWEQKAVALLDSERPTVEHTGRHQLDITKYDY